MARLGLHLSTAMGLEMTARAALTQGCETLQIFSGSPVTWSAPELDQTAVAVFAETLSDHDIRPLILHAPYLVNLAAVDDLVRARSRQSLSTAVHRAATLGASYVVTHVGSHKGAGLELGMESVAREAARVLAYDTSRVMLLLENGSGGGNTIGSTLAEIRELLDRLAAQSSRVGVCLDTAHLWGAGYDIGDPIKWLAFLDQFHQTIGLSRLRVIHINDSAARLGSRRDLHQTPGEGAIGLDTFESILTDPRLAEMPLIMELPTRLKEPHDTSLDRMKALRTGARG